MRHHRQMLWILLALLPIRLNASDRTYTAPVAFCGGEISGQKASVTLFADQQGFCAAAEEPKLPYSALLILTDHSQEIGGIPHSALLPTAVIVGRITHSDMWGAWSFNSIDEKGLKTQLAISQYKVGKDVPAKFSVDQFGSWNLTCESQSVICQ